MVSNIGSRTTSTPANTTVLGYYYAESVISHSNIVLEESMMQVSFGLTTPRFQEFSFFLKKKAKKSKIINTSASWDLRRVVA